MTDTAQLVSRYAERFHARYLDHHGTASALGLWLLLALVAPAATGDERRTLEEHLGCDAHDAGRRAAALLASPHPAVRAAVAVWANEGWLGERYRQWAPTLARAVETGPIPSQVEADAWADRSTGGLIDTFPVVLGPDTALVLASALATDVTWIEPFTEVAAAELGGPFGARTETALDASGAHLQHLVATDAAGIVAVHVAAAAAGLRVVSVLAAADVAPARVHRAALEVAAALPAVGLGEAPVVDVFALPLGEGPAWTLDERVIEVAGAAGDRRVTHRSVLPAWSAQSDHDLADAPGIDAAFVVLEGLLAPSARPGAFDARQTAVAEFSREGFKAAAVTVIAMRAGFARLDPRTVTERVVTARFNRPYAVLAVADRITLDPSGMPVEVDEPSWAGMPVFAAWVTEPRDAADPSTAEAIR